MATNTPNINLSKPDYTENADIGVLNANADKIDAAVKALQDLIAALQTSTTPQAILNAIKTVDGTGSGLDADLLDGKDSLYFSKSGFGFGGEFSKQVTGDCLNIKDGNDYVNTIFTGLNLTNAPTTGQWYHYHQQAITNLYVTLFAIPATSGNPLIRRMVNGIWDTEWKEVGNNLFTYPKTFNVINAQAGQTVFSYSGGSGRVITVNTLNTNPEITIDGIVVSYSNYPYSGTGTTGTSQVINLEFKNSVVIKTVQAATGNVTGLIQTEKA